jgi:hypothetical protein
MNSLDVVHRIVEAFQKLEISYMTVGSFSSNVYGKPRSTKDADFVVQLEGDSINRLARELGPAFQLDPQMTFESITSTMRYRIKLTESAFLIELFLLSNDPHDQARFNRRVTGHLEDGTKVFLPTAEDVVITKLRWSKQGRRQKDVNDVFEVVAVQFQKLDLAYIRHWCDLHGTRDLFEKILNDAQQLLN